MENPLEEMKEKNDAKSIKEFIKIFIFITSSLVLINFITNLIGLYFCFEYFSLGFKRRKIENNIFDSILVKYKNSYFIWALVFAIYEYWIWTLIFAILAAISCRIGNFTKINARNLILINLILAAMYFLVTWSWGYFEYNAKTNTVLDISDGLKENMHIYHGINLFYIKDWDLFKCASFFMVHSANSISFICKICFGTILLVFIWCKRYNSN